MLKFFKTISLQTVFVQLYGHLKFRYKAGTRVLSTRSNAVGRPAYKVLETLTLNITFKFYRFHIYLFKPCRYNKKIFSEMLALNNLLTLQIVCDVPCPATPNLGIVS